MFPFSLPEPNLPTPHFLSLSSLSLPIPPCPRTQCLHPLVATGNPGPSHPPLPPLSPHSGTEDGPHVCPSCPPHLHRGSSSLRPLPLLLAVHLHPHVSPRLLQLHAGPRPIHHWYIIHYGGGGRDGEREAEFKIGENTAQQQPFLTFSIPIHFIVVLNVPECIGVDSQYFNVFEKPSDVCVVDLDTSTITL